MDAVCWFSSRGISEYVPEASYTVWSPNVTTWIESQRINHSSHTGVPLSLRMVEPPSRKDLRTQRMIPFPCSLLLPFHSNTLVRFKPVYKLAKGWNQAKEWGLSVTQKFTCMPNTWWGFTSMKASNRPTDLSSQSTAAASRSVDEDLPAHWNPITLEICVFAAWNCKGNRCSRSPASQVMHISVAPEHNDYQHYNASY